MCGGCTLSAFTPRSAARRTSAAASSVKRGWTPPIGISRSGAAAQYCGDVLVHAVGEAHEVGARVVDEHRALDPVRVQPAQQVLRALHDLLQLVARRSRPRGMTSSTSGFSSHQGWTWMWASVIRHAARITRCICGHNRSGPWRTSRRRSSSSRTTKRRAPCSRGSSGSRGTPSCPPPTPRLAVALARAEQPDLILSRHHHADDGRVRGAEGAAGRSRRPPRCRSCSCPGTRTSASASAPSASA